MSELLTLEKSHPDFEKYLLGSFSKTKRALPTQTLNVSSPHERVTFRIVDVDKIAKPFMVLRWIQLFKVKNFLLVLFPIFLISVKNFSTGKVVDPLLSLLAAAGVLFLHVAVNLRNDFDDHMNGLDRINSKAGSRAIQSGWVTAHQVRTLSWFFVALGVLCGAPVLKTFEPVVAGVSILLFVLFFGVRRASLGKYYRGHNEAVAFFLLGPLLTIGYDWAMIGGFDFETIAIGALVGWLAIFTLHLKNFEQIMVQSQASFVNVINKIGFDKSRRLLTWWWAIFFVTFLIYHHNYLSQFWTGVDFLLLSILSIPFVTRLWHMQSSVGSDVVRVVRRGRILYLMVISLWFIETMWTYLEAVEWRF